MRPNRFLLALAVPALLLAACGDDDDGGSAAVELTAAEQEYADGFAKGLVDDDDGLGVSEDEGDCMGAAIMVELGTDIFEDADVTPEDVAGEETPGELLGDGKITDAQADAILERWDDCADLPALIAAGGAEADLDEDGAKCLEDGLRDGEVVHDLLRVSFTSGDSDATPEGESFEAFLSLIQDCSANDSGEGGVLVDGIAESFAADGSLNEEQSRCMAQFIVDEIGADRLASLGGSGNFDNAPADVQQEFAAAVIDAAGECDVSIADLGG